MKILYVGLLERTPCKMYPYGVEISVKNSSYLRQQLDVPNGLDMIDAVLNFNAPITDWGMVEGIGFYDSHGGLVAWSACTSKAILKGDSAPRIIIDKSKVHNINMLRSGYLSTDCVDNYVDILTDNGSKLLMYRDDDGLYQVWYKTSDVNRLTRHYKSSKEYTLSSDKSFQEILHKLYMELYG